ncbi:O-antigen translocase [Providencia alcalifaciens]|uniref:Polysaccharide biosynthesis protein n=1 Tax=Providencia stuartii TaxID=588 RepID=A0A346CLF5_PROST|nr:O-antigen translocase [Providencia sp. PROV209]AXL96429.1 polysaccharide biosynthesis protein [Providencia stuartii]QLQ97466.1 O-antigen translocase [Providencia alcalifaciens]
MNLLKTSILSFISVLVKMLALLGINKIIAIYAGPTGYASFGQFQNLMQMFNLIGSGGINNGVIKLTAEHNGKSEIQYQVWKTAFILSLVCTLFTSIVIISLRDFLSLYFFSTNSFEIIFVILSFSLFFLILNNFLLSILNGNGEIKKYTLANILGSILSVLFTLFLTFQYKLTGALIALCTYQSVSFIVTFILFIKTKYFSRKIFSAQFNPSHAKILLKFSLMTLVSAICTPLTLILIRNIINHELSWADAGYWEAAYRLSSVYTMIFSSILVVYFLPKFSFLQSKKEIIKEVKSGYILLTPFLIFSAVILYSTKEIIISILFSNEFSSVSEILKYQIIGDFIKIYGVLLSYLLISKSMTFEYITSEILFSFSFLIFSFILIKYMQLEGVTLAYLISYSIYLAINLFFIKKRISYKL